MITLGILIVCNFLGTYLLIAAVQRHAESIAMASLRASSSMMKIHDPEYVNKLTEAHKQFQKGQ